VRERTARKVGDESPTKRPAAAKGLPRCAPIFTFSPSEKLASCRGTARMVRERTLLTKRPAAAEACRPALKLQLCVNAPPEQLETKSLNQTAGSGRGLPRCALGFSIAPKHLLHFLALPTGPNFAFGAGWSGEPHVYHKHNVTLPGSSTLCDILRCVFTTTTIFGTFSWTCAAAFADAAVVTSRFQLRAFNLPTSPFLQISRFQLRAFNFALSTSRFAL